MICQRSIGEDWIRAEQLMSWVSAILGILLEIMQESFASDDTESLRDALHPHKTHFLQALDHSCGCSPT